MQRDLKISNSLLGFLIFASFTGFTISALVNGFAADIFTDKIVLTIGFAIFAVVLMLFPLVRSFPFLIFTYFMARFGLGAIDITASTQGTRLFQKNAAIKINLLHLTFAIGATIAPIIGTQLLEIGIGWQRILFFFCIPCALFCILSACATFAPQSPRPIKNLKQEFKVIIGDRNLWILGGLLAIAIIGEGNFIDWIKKYSVEIGGLDNIRSGNLIGLFYLFLVLSRAISGFIAQRIGIMRFYFIYLCGALVFFVLAVLLPFRSILFVTVGWFIGPLFPIVTLMAAQIFPKQKASAIGLVFAIGGLVATFNSFLLGIMHDVFGTQIGFSLMAVGLCLGVPVALYAKRRFGHLTV